VPHPTNKHERKKMGKAKARRLLKIYRALSNNPNDSFYSEDGKFAKRLQTTRVPCSCSGCGNQRKWEGMTRGEIIAYLNEQDQINEELGL